MKDKIYVLAANYEQARNYAYKKGYHYTDMVNIDRPDKLRGLRKVTIHVIDGAMRRKNYNAIMLLAIEQNNVIINV